MEPHEDGDIDDSHADSDPSPPIEEQEDPAVIWHSNSTLGRKADPISDPSRSASLSSSEGVARPSEGPPAVPIPVEYALRTVQSKTAAREGYLRRTSSASGGPSRVVSEAEERRRASMSRQGSRETAGSGSGSFPGSRRASEAGKPGGAGGSRRESREAAGPGSLPGSRRVSDAGKLGGAGGSRRGSQDPGFGLEPHPEEAAGEAGEADQGDDTATVVDSGLESGSPRATSDLQEGEESERSPRVLPSSADSDSGAVEGTLSNDEAFVSQDVLGEDGGEVEDALGESSEEIEGVAQLEGSQSLGEEPVEEMLEGELPTDSVRRSGTEEAIEEDIDADLLKAS